MNLNILKKVIKDCYWDYNISVDDLKSRINGDNKREIQKIFEKIIYNSTDKTRTLQELFNKKQLIELFDKFKPNYNEKYINRKVLVLRNILLDEDNYIEVLAWKKR